MNVLSLEATLKLIELAGKPYRPPEIIALQEKISTKTASLEVKAYAGGVTYKISQDQKKILEIIDMKLQLDILYAEWAEREVSSGTIPEGGCDYAS